MMKSTTMPIMIGNNTTRKSTLLLQQNVGQQQQEKEATNIPPPPPPPPPPTTPPPNTPLVVTYRDYEETTATQKEKPIDPPCRDKPTVQFPLPATTTTITTDDISHRSSFRSIFATSSSRSLTTTTNNKEVNCDKKKRKILRYQRKKKKGSGGGTYGRKKENDTQTTKTTTEEEFDNNNHHRVLLTSSSSSLQLPAEQQPAGTTTTIKERIATHKHLYKDHPHNLLLALFLFVILVASGISMACIFASEAKETYKQEALALAEETGLYFSKNLDDAILPLFSLAQFVHELDIFQNLAEQIGLAGGGVNSLPQPMLPSLLEEEDPTYRNVSGICDDPELVQRFNKIAGDIKKNAKMDGILLNLQLVPDAVICLSYPLNNTEDFSNGIFMDTTSMIGYDLLADPIKNKFIAEKTVRSSDDVIIEGPGTLRQCDKNKNKNNNNDDDDGTRRSECDPIVENAFVARLPVSSETNAIVVNGMAFPKWGFVVAIINWNELILRSGIYDVFEDQDMEFQLFRTDLIFNSTDVTYTEMFVKLAQSTNFETSRGEQVSTVLPTATNDDWEITITYCTDGCNRWLPWVILIVVLMSSFISLLVYIVFSQKQIHSNALAEKQEQMVNNARKAAKKERELNDFIAHEVRNPLGAALSAVSFVSTAVNERRPLRDSESRQSVREDVHIIESSLQFINDLLRSMLDLHRVQSSKRLSLELHPTDIKQDILEPVVSMLYHRDSMFTVSVECPDNLIASVDRLRLKQIVLNLARNSCKFVEKGFVRIRAESTDDGIVIFVEDSGPGIPLQKRHQLFAKFQDSLDDLSQGTGIGLSLCKKLIDLMKGSITLDESFHSGLQHRPGAKFDIRIPCDTTALNDLYEPDEMPDIESVGTLGGSSTCHTAEWEESSSTSLDYNLEAHNSFSSLLSEQMVLPDHLRVLFVDDDMINRKMFIRSLKRIRPNWTVHEAASGESALLLLESETFDVIFLDQYMSSAEKQLLGTETARKMRSFGMDCLICGLSANDMEEPFINAGADAFMKKPFPCKPEPLTAALLSLLNKRSDLLKNTPILRKTETARTA